MPTQIKEKIADPEKELSNVQTMFKKLQPVCSVEKRAGGIPQLAPQEKQIGILKSEMKETKLCIGLATHGGHAIRDAQEKTTMGHSIVEYEKLETEVKSNRVQLVELDYMNNMAAKEIVALLKRVPTEADELAMLEDAHNRLRRMENRLDLATKRFCVVNSNNKHIREDIHRLLVERNSFNFQWNNVIKKLRKGKEYLLDILEIATRTFADRDECCRKLETLKWKGLHQLNKDIAEMQSYEGELNHLAKLEEFLRVKGSTRICEADEIEEAKRLDEMARCEEEIKKHDTLLEEIFSYAGTSHVGKLINLFENKEISNFSIVVLLCEVLQEIIVLKKIIEGKRQTIMDQRDINEGRNETQERRLTELRKQLEDQQQNTRQKQLDNNNAEATFIKVMKGIDDLCKLIKCDITPLMSLLGNHKEVTPWNVTKFLRILETETKSLIQVAYGAVKPPAPTPTKARKPAVPDVKLVADPKVIQLEPNLIENLVPYQPCAYCVEDYMMNQVFETPAVPATREYIENIFHLEDVNTKFGIFTLTIPTKRHPFKGSKD